MKGGVEVFHDHIQKPPVCINKPDHGICVPEKRCFDHHRLENLSNISPMYVRMYAICQVDCVRGKSV